jgi:hypothetical protein
MTQNKHWCFNAKSNINFGISINAIWQFNVKKKKVCLKKLKALLSLIRRVYKTAQKLLLASSCVSVRPSVRPSACLSFRMELDGFSLNMILEKFFYNQSRNTKFQKYLTRIEGNWHEHLYTFTIVFRWMLFRIRTVSRKGYRENQNTRFMFNDVFAKIVPFTRCGKNMVKPGRPQMTVRHMQIACWIPNATNTH